MKLFITLGKAGGKVKKGTEKQSPEGVKLYEVTPFQGSKVGE